MTKYISQNKQNIYSSPQNEPYTISITKQDLFNTSENLDIVHCDLPSCVVIKGR